MMQDRDTTGPDDDEELGHGGVEVPTEEMEGLPQASDEDGIGDLGEAAPS